MIIEITKIGILIIITSKSVLIDFPMPGILGKAKKLIAKYTTTTTMFSAVIRMCFFKFDFTFSPPIQNHIAIQVCYEQ